MRLFRILSVIGYLLILFGLGTVVYQGFIAHSTGTSTVEIPAGQGYYAVFKTKSSMWMNAHFEGTIEVQGGTVNAYLLNSAEYTEYAYNLNPSSNLWTTHGDSGSFSVDLPEMGRYYVVADHGSGSFSVPQTVKLTYTISGINLFYVIVGALLVAIGAALLFIGLRMKRKSWAAMPIPATAPVTEVKMFDSKQKLQ